MSQSTPAPNGNSHPATSDAAPTNGKAANGFPAGRRGYPQPHHVEQLQTFWENQTKQVEEETDFKNHNLPLARIKKIMKADEDVRMISSEAPVVFAKACEMFIMELTMRSWMHTEENKRRTLQKSDIAAAVSRTDVYDFLVDIVPRDDGKEEVLGSVMPYYIPVPPPGTVFHGGAWPEPHVPPPPRSDDE